MNFGSGYYSPMDREYEQIDLDSYPSLEEPVVAEPVVGMSEMGMSVTEGGRFGPLGQTVQSAIRLGTGRIEMNVGMGGAQEPVGAESYGKEAREELRELAKANEIQFTSVHAPPQIGNLSGYNAQQGTFSDEFRRDGLDEVKKAIKFAGDAAQGGAVVVHTGEFNRPITGTWDNDKYKFAGYPEEEQKAVAQLVDDRTGQVLMQVRRSQIIHRPRWRMSDKDFEGEDREGNQVSISKGDYVDYEDRKVDEAHRVPIYNQETGRFEVEKRTWSDFVKDAERKNEEREVSFGRGLKADEVIKPEELFLKEQVQSQIDQAKGWSLYHSQQFEDLQKNLDKFKKAKEFWDKIESATSEDEKENLKRQFQVDNSGLIPPDIEMPSDFINKRLKDIRKNMEHIHESSVSYEQQAKEQELILEHAKPVDRYATERSLASYGEAGVFAMKETKDNPHTQRDIYVAPENIFPEMGYGSHPEELIELVQGARKNMVNLLTQTKVADPTGRLDESGKAVMVNNPNYDGSLSQKEAEDLAARHIKATFDTQHLGMWWKHFVPEAGESEEDRRKRFNEWYMEEVKKMEDAGIIGHIHVVDSLGGGHHHLPAGQGDLPVVDAVEYLKKKGYGGTMISEGFEENMKYGAARQLEATWKAFGSPIYGMGSGVPKPGAPVRFGDVHQSYFGLNAPPTYIFGSYSPSNDWTLWSQVPME
ncbi:TIM barrel protein [Nanoarchaeota archaeon]